MCIGCVIMLHHAIDIRCQLIIQQMAPHVFFVLFNSNHQAALRIDALFIMDGMAAICISIELYEIVQLWSGVGVALPLTLSLTVGVAGLTLRGGSTY